MNQPCPNFLIVGAAKSGTTSLHHYLNQHPQIFMSKMKEPTYFVNDYGVENWTDYLELFKDAAGKRAVGESSTLYLCCEESPQLIKSALKNIKIIIILRNPARRAFSLYNWMVNKGFENAPTFAEALEQESNRLTNPAFRASLPYCYPDCLYYTTGLYYEQVRRYLDIFGRDSVKIYLFEDFIKAPLKVCQNIFEFLGVDAGFVPKTDVHNESWIPVSTSFQYWLRIKAGRRLRFLPRWLRRNLIHQLMALNLRYGRKPQPDKNLIEMLANRYREDIRQLEMLLNRDLSQWTNMDKTNGGLTANNAR
jgi:hypothetical protein